MARTAPFGSWASPMTSERIVSESSPIRELAADVDGAIYWTEQRSADGGKTSLVRQAPDGTRTDVVAPPFDVRSRVHEYGGGAFAVSAGTVVFSNDADRRVYRIDPGSAPVAITPAQGDARYADLVIDRLRKRVFAVREVHDGGDVTNEIVSIALDGEGSPRTAVTGADFYAAPRLSPDGRQLAFLSWEQPDMPWDSTDLCVADLHLDGSLGPAKTVAGGPRESVQQPSWSPRGDLYFVSDRTGWWNLYIWRHGRADPVSPAQAEMGGPQWVFGMSTYAFENEERIICAVNRDGLWALEQIDTLTRRRSTLSSHWTQINDVRAIKDRVWLLAGSPSEPISVIEMDARTNQFQVIQRASGLRIDESVLSIPRALEYPTEGGAESHALFYAPKNGAFEGPPGERPPLVVMIHGGPTASARSSFSAEIQFFTSRGFGVLDVNYGGSTGFGRKYRERLYGTWGVVDVDDCARGALFLADKGLADRKRLAIRGGSAGGFTTLAALAFRDVFTAGASSFGVSDLAALASDTHKFEARYLDRLVGPYPARKDLYDARSPLVHAGRIKSPVIFFQGSEDKIVPPDQTKRMADALRKNKVPVAEIHFAGESHGFRKKENIRRALDAELYFYSKVFKFELADPVEPVTIDNL